jgi:GntR family transcriptional regulator/MocR family aminotransferase
VQYLIPIPESGGPLFRRIYQGVRAAILAGALPAQGRLPSSRELADQLGVSRTVVVYAYEQLLAEGFVTGRTGSGTYVAQGIGQNKVAPSAREADLRRTRFGHAAAAAWSRVNFPAHRSPPPQFDFAYGRSDLDTFPHAMWRRTLLRCARRAASSGMDYGAASGNVALREAISAHLRRSRAVHCDAARVIVVNGSQQALDLITRVLIEAGDDVAIEDPAYQGTTESLRAAGARLLPVAVDREGIDPARLPAGARAVFVTPSHQYPTGATLPLTRRMALLDWARSRNAVIVEDDYDGEFRYDGQPLESLQGLDRDSRVIYIGTFSRTMYASLRVGYIVAPPSLVAALTAAKWLSDRHTPDLEQQALAEFISSGMYERYLRRARRRSASRRRVLLAAIRKHLGDRVEVTGDGAGAHVVLWPRRRIGEQTLISRAAARGVGVYGISAYYLRPVKRTGILLGYSRLSEAAIQEGISRLGKLL